MKNDVIIQEGIIIPSSELTISASRSGGPGGQHVNKTSSKITIHWNIKNSVALSPQQKDRVMAKLQSRLSAEGELIVHNSSSRSQQQNKMLALAHLAQIIRKALYVPKKRIKTTISQGSKAKRLQSKKQRSEIKKMRIRTYYDE